MESNEPFVAVILDLTIAGGMGGSETIKELLKIDHDVTAIVASGYSNDPVVSNSRKYGFSGVVAKPYKIYDLDKVLQKAMKGKQTGNPHYQSCVAFLPYYTQDPKTTSK